MSGKAYDLWAVMGVAGGALSAVLAGGSEPTIRAVLTLPLVLVLPGYALTAATFSESSLAVTERLLFSVGASITLAVTAGFVLNWTPWGMSPVSWAALLAGITVIASAVALVRRRKRPAIAPRWAAIRPTALQLVVGIAAVGLTAWAIVVARAGVADQYVVGFTQLWMVPLEYPDPPGVYLGFRNEEDGPHAYRLRVEAGDVVLWDWTSITVDTGEGWDKVAFLPPGWDSPAPLEAKLYRDDDQEEPYRQAIVWPRASGG